MRVRDALRRLGDGHLIVWEGQPRPGWCNEAHLEAYGCAEGDEAARELVAEARANGACGAVTVLRGPDRLWGCPLCDGEPYDVDDTVKE